MYLGNSESVKLTIDQSAEVRFEMVIMSFFSGFNRGSEHKEYDRVEKVLADYAYSKGITLGVYSLLASRSAREEVDIINHSPVNPVISPNMWRSVK